MTAGDRYTHGHAEPVLQSHRWRTAENSAGYLLPSLRSGLDLLDVGCGPGTITVDLAARVAPGRVLGIDISDEPLAEARGLAERSGVDVTFEVGDVYALAEPDDSFDVVHAHQVLQHLTDPVARPAHEGPHHPRSSGEAKHQELVVATTSLRPAACAHDRSRRPAFGSLPLRRCTRWYRSSQASRPGSSGNQASVA